MRTRAISGAGNKKPHDAIMGFGLNLMREHYTRIMLQPLSAFLAFGKSDHTQAQHHQAISFWLWYWRCSNGGG